MFELIEICPQQGDTRSTVAISNSLLTICKKMDEEVSKARTATNWYMPDCHMVYAIYKGKQRLSTRQAYPGCP